MCPVTESLLINGRLRLYLELSHTFSVHDAYKSVQYLQHNQDKDTTTEKNSYRKQVTSVTITRKYMPCYHTEELITLHELTIAFYFQLSCKLLIFT